MRIKIIVFLAATITLLSFIFPNKNNSYTPPGTVKIATNLFMDESEITNISWQESMYWTERIYGKTSDQYVATIPDSNVWSKEYKTHYLSHPAYRDYPVVGISWKQAKQFCAWRSDRVIEHVIINKELKPKKNYPTKVTYRLPTTQEWEHIANSGYSEKTMNKFEIKYANSPKANFRSLESNITNTTNTTSPAFQYWPNKFGVYNMLGNVAEMTDQEGVAKGGSWVQLEEEVTITKVFEYKKPTNWVGFRCICEVEF